MFIKGLSLISFLTILVLSGCSTQHGRYQQKNDSTPTRLPTTAELKDAVPRAEPYSRGGNKNYTVRGKHYQVLKTANDFSETGIASWYGKKFHGHLTSNGEIYNMYGMSAAHKNLPLPTYVKVTNQANNKSVIVRVNDRGPFHQSRVIDLSYSAAYKLDMLKTGTAKVHIEVVSEFDHQTKSHLFDKKLSYIQVFATKNLALAKKTAQKLEKTYLIPAKWTKSNNIYRVKLGPIKNQDKIPSLIKKLRVNGFPEAFSKKV